MSFLRTIALVMSMTFAVGFVLVMLQGEHDKVVKRCEAKNGLLIKVDGGAKACVKLQNVIFVE